MKLAKIAILGTSLFLSSCDCNRDYTTFKYEGKDVPVLGGDIKMKIHHYDWEIQGDEFKLCLRVSAGAYSGKVCEKKGEKVENKKRKRNDLYFDL